MDHTLPRGSGRAPPPRAPPTVSVASYNVLSDALSSPAYFRHCEEKDCDPATRLARVKEQLRVQMRRRSIICLQEVSRQWGAELVPFFEANRYNYTTGLSGSRGNGYMGQCLAWPTELYTVEEVAVKRLSDTVIDQGVVPDRNDGYKSRRRPAEAARPEGLLRRAATAATGLKDRLLGGSRPADGLWKNRGRPGIGGGRGGRGLDHDVPPLDVWGEALSRHNCVVLARLRPRSRGAGGRRFCVASYHMPCLFGSDVVRPTSPGGGDVL